MFDQLLKESVAKGEVITAAIGQQASEVANDTELAEGLIAARRLFEDPEHIQRLVTRMGIFDIDKTCPWW